MEVHPILVEICILELHSSFYHLRTPPMSTGSPTVSTITHKCTRVSISINISRILVTAQAGLPRVLLGSRAITHPLQQPLIMSTSTTHIISLRRIPCLQDLPVSHASRRLPFLQPLQQRRQWQRFLRPLRWTTTRFSLHFRFYRPHFRPTIYHSIRRSHCPRFQGCHRNRITQVPAPAVVTVADSTPQMHIAPPTLPRL